MEYTHELKLIQHTTTKDEIGQLVHTETSTDVLCKPNVVGTKEFYNAQAVGITPTAELQIRLSNYSNEQEVEYKGVRYSVIRTIQKGKFDVVLVIGTKQGVNG